MMGDAGGKGLDLEKRVPLNRLATTTDVANIVLFLFSQEADFYTALAVPVCGGLSAL